jgi:hypothetical protein
VITGDYRPGRVDNSEEINVTYKQVIAMKYELEYALKCSNDPFSLIFRELLVIPSF